MDTTIEFKPKDYDELSEIPSLHLSYIIKALLPIRLIGWKVTKRHYYSVKSSFLQYEAITGDFFEYLPVGSLAEGYSIPNTITKSRPPRFDNFSDIDVLFVNRPFTISSTKEYDVSAFKGYCDWQNTHPGYTRVCLPKIKENDEMFIYNEELNLYHLSSDKYRQKTFSTWNLLESSVDKFVDSHGPAISIEYQESPTIDDPNWKEKNLGLSNDVVMALPCNPWPEIANAWKERISQSSWLDASLIESIIQDGCHVVAVPHKKSAEPEIEWRLSFSASEGRLAREAVTDYQRQCFIFLKILRHQVMKTNSKEEPILSSYVFKSVFLHCCEKLPVDSWKENPAYCVLYMIDVLLECLEKRHVPSYFLPENNLIGHLDEKEIHEVVQILYTLRLDPITPILEFTDNRLIGLQPATLNFRDLVDRLLGDMKVFKQHQSFQKSVNDGVFLSAFTCCLLLLEEQTNQKESQLAKHKEAVHCMVDIFPLMQKYLYPQMSLTDFMNLIGISIPDLKRCVRFYEATVNLLDVYPEFSALRGNFGCMCHSYSYSFPEQSQEREHYLQKSETVFKSLFEEGYQSSTIDYVTYLMKRSKFADAVPILENFIKDDRVGNLYNTYGKLEMETLDEILKKEVETQGKFGAEGLAFAYYYLVVCLCKSEKAMSWKYTILEGFETHCASVNKGSSFALLAHAWNLIDDQLKADIALGRCLELWPEYKSIHNVQ